ncbi:PHP domain-containing protein [Pseudoglutamicibacter albus]|uniref:hypothetical protein n=1 Tax=Pseudoglutamicibacter albus TaxID=98671 RepID=UPI003610BD09
MIRASDLEECVDAGLAGVEIHHRDNNQAGREWLHKVARERNLIITGSSDYHGTGKPNRLGENLTEPEQLQKSLPRPRPPTGAPIPPDYLQNGCAELTPQVQALLGAFARTGAAALTAT